MGLSRSPFYDPPPVAAAPGEVPVRIKAICDEFECYGYRRMGAALRNQGMVVNSKKLRRLMREHDLHPPMAFQRRRRWNLSSLPKQRRRYVVTTDSEHDRPIFKNLTKGLVLERPNQLDCGSDLDTVGEFRRQVSMVMEVTHELAS